MLLVNVVKKKKSVLWYLKNYVHKRHISKKYVWLWSIIENFKNLENKYNYYFKKHENNILSHILIEIQFLKINV